MDHLLPCLVWSCKDPQIQCLYCKKPRLVISVHRLPPTFSLCLSMSQYSKKCKCDFNYVHIINGTKCTQCSADTEKNNKYSNVNNLHKDRNVRHVNFVLLIIHVLWCVHFTLIFIQFHVFKTTFVSYDRYLYLQAWQAWEVLQSYLCDVSNVCFLRINNVIAGPPQLS